MAKSAVKMAILYDENVDQDRGTAGEPEPFLKWLGIFSVDPDRAYGLMGVRPRPTDVSGRPAMLFARLRRCDALSKGGRRHGTVHWWNIDDGHTLGMSASGACWLVPPYTIDLPDGLMEPKRPSPEAMRAINELRDERYARAIAEEQLLTLAGAVARLLNFVDDGPKVDFRSSLKLRAPVQMPIPVWLGIQGESARLRSITDALLGIEPEPEQPEQIDPIDRWLRENGRTSHFSVPPSMDELTEAEANWVRENVSSACLDLSHLDCEADRYRNGTTRFHIRKACPCDCHWKGSPGPENTRRPTRS